MLLDSKQLIPHNGHFEDLAFFRFCSIVVGFVYIFQTSFMI